MIQVKRPTQRNRQSVIYALDLTKDLIIQERDRVICILKESFSKLVFTDNTTEFAYYSTLPEDAKLDHKVTKNTLTLNDIAIIYDKRNTSK